MTPPRRLGRTVLAAVLGLFLLLAPGLAHAHAGLLTADPPDGALLAEAPPAVTLRFDGPVRPLVARLTGPDGATRLLPDAEVVGEDLRWTLPPGLAQGSHLLSWRVVADDGHPIAGGTVFSVGTASAVAGAAAEAPWATRIGLWAARAVVVGAVLFAVGGAVFAAFAELRVSRAAAGIGLLALPVAVGFQGLDLLGLGPPSLGDPAIWMAAVEGDPGAAVSLTALALVLSLGRGALPAGAALLAAALAAALSGHAATADPQILMRPAIALHVAAAALWVGALAPLAANLARGATLDRFSLAAPWVVGLLLLTGGALAVVQVERVGALLTTAYGQVLLAKLGLVAGLLALAAWNRFRLTARGDSLALRRSIAVEIGLAVLVIATLALWRFTPPPRALAPAAGEIQATLTRGDLSARVVVAPARPGPVTVRLEDLRQAGRPIAPLDATLEFSKPAYGLGPFRRAVVPGQPAAFLLPMDGIWVVRLNLRLDEFQAAEIIDLVELPVPRP